MLAGRPGRIRGRRKPPFIAVQDSSRAAAPFLPVSILKSTKGGSCGKREIQSYAPPRHYASAPPPVRRRVTGHLNSDGS